jgi:hypothetical protein
MCFYSDFGQFFHSNFLVISDKKVNNMIVWRGWGIKQIKSCSLVCKLWQIGPRSTRQQGAVKKRWEARLCNSPHEGPCVPVPRCPYCLVTNSRNKNRICYLEPVLLHVLRFYRRFCFQNNTYRHT